MQKFLFDFRGDEDGAVTVDWIVLTAVMVGFGIVVVTIVATAATHPVDGIGAALVAYNPRF